MSDRALKLALRANALFCGSSGLYLAAFARQASQLTLSAAGGAGEWLFRGAGIGLLAYAALLARLSGRAADRPREVTTVIVGDVLWVAGSAVWIALASRSLSATGADIVVGVAAIVGLFALLQWLAMRASGRSAA